MTSSAEMTITRRQRPARIQSSASATACVVLAQAELICVLGPRAPMNSANCECPIDKTRSRKRRSKDIRLFLDGVPQLFQCAAQFPVRERNRHSTSLPAPAGSPAGPIVRAGSDRCNSAPFHRRTSRSPGKRKRRSRRCRRAKRRAEPSDPAVACPCVVVL